MTSKSVPHVIAHTVLGHSDGSQLPPIQDRITGLFHFRVCQDAATRILSSFQKTHVEFEVEFARTHSHSFKEYLGCSHPCLGSALDRKNNDHSAETILADEPFYPFATIPPACDMKHLDLIKSLSCDFGAVPTAGVVSKGILHSMDLFTSAVSQLEHGLLHAGLSWGFLSVNNRAFLYRMEFNVLRGKLHAVYQSSFALKTLQYRLAELDITEWLVATRGVCRHVASAAAFEYVREFIASGLSTLDDGSGSSAPTPPSERTVGPTLSTRISRLDSTIPDYHVHIDILAAIQLIDEHLLGSVTESQLAGSSLTVLQLVTAAAKVQAIAVDWNQYIDLKLTAFIHDVCNDLRDLCISVAGVAASNSEIEVAQCSATTMLQELAAELEM